MRIKHTKVACGPDGSFQPGAVRDTDNPGDNLTVESAKQLVKGGYAEDVTPAINPAADKKAWREAAAAAEAVVPVIPQPQSSRSRKAT